MIRPLASATVSFARVARFSNSEMANQQKNSVVGNGTDRGRERTPVWPPAWLSRREVHTETALEAMSEPQPAAATKRSDCDPFCPEGQHAWQDTAESDGKTRRFCTKCCKFAGFVQPDGSVVEVA